ncbi:MAG: RNA-binding protein [Clostridia bacterium]|nr:RNA-binding protein [Clostridia bacterium]
MERPITVGSIVYSRAGRDEGRYYMVTAILDDSYVTIADGSVRKLAKPKKKKIKHLKNTGEVLDNIAGKLLTSAKIYDAEIFSALRKYNS